MTLNVSKGIAVAVVVFILATYNIPKMIPILDIVLAFIVYSIVLSTIVIKLSRNFLGEETQ
jgi:hypothetical protein